MWKVGVPVIPTPLNLKRGLQEDWCIRLWKLPLTHASLNLHPKEVPVAFDVFPNYPGNGRLRWENGHMMNLHPLELASTGT